MGWELNCLDLGVKRVTDDFVGAMVSLFVVTQTEIGPRMYDPALALLCSRSIPVTLVPVIWVTLANASQQTWGPTSVPAQEVSDTMSCAAARRGLTKATCHAKKNTFGVITFFSPRDILTRVHFVILGKVCLIKTTYLFYRNFFQLTYLFSLNKKHWKNQKLSITFYPQNTQLNKGNFRVPQKFQFTIDFLLVVS